MASAGSRRRRQGNAGLRIQGEAVRDRFLCEDSPAGDVSRGTLPRCGEVLGRDTKDLTRYGIPSEILKAIDAFLCVAEVTAGVPPVLKLIK